MNTYSLVKQRDDETEWSITDRAEVVKKISLCFDPEPFDHILERRGLACGSHQSGADRREVGGVIECVEPFEGFD